MCNREVNGWRNRATWLVNLWYEPRTVSDVNYLEEAIEDEFLDMMEKQYGSTAHFYTDLIDFTTIDWDSLREHCEEEEE
jgi:hypothetical protein